MADFPCMLAHKYDAKHAQFPAIVEPKLDGIRALVIVDPRQLTAQAHSRAGNEFTSVRAIENALLMATVRAGIRRRVLFDGELSCGTFKQTVSAIKKKNVEAKDARLMLFDMLEGWPHENNAEHGESFGTLAQRRVKLEALYVKAQAAWPTQLQYFPLDLTETYTARDDEDVQGYYAAFRTQGLEGAIVKDPRANWSPKRSRAYLKLKERDTLDLPIADAIEGLGRLKGTLGALVCSLCTTCGGSGRYSDLTDEHDCEACTAQGKASTVCVGSGIPDDERAELWAMHQRGELAGRTVEVSFHERTPDGSLRHPVYEGLRLDK